MIYLARLRKTWPVGNTEQRQSVLNDKIRLSLTFRLSDFQLEDWIFSFLINSYAHFKYLHWNAARNPCSTRNHS